MPDLVQKVVKGQDPLHILGDGSQIRHYTYGGDLARGIVIAMEHEAARNEDFNLSTRESTTVLELAELIWTKINGAAVPFRYVSDDPFEHDVHKRIPATEKAAARPRLPGGDEPLRHARRGHPLDISRIDGRRAHLQLTSLPPVEKRR